MMVVGFVTIADTADRVLSDVARCLRSEGVRICGVVQANVNRPGHRCDMELSVLPDGPQIRISQDLGKESRGCRLDHGALETAVGHVERAMETQFDLLVVNKFGKREAEGRGFRSAIAEAIGKGLPVLVGVSTANEAAFMHFAGGEAERLPADTDVVLDWCRTVLRGEQAAQVA